MVLEYLLPPTVEHSAVAVRPLSFRLPSTAAGKRAGQHPRPIVFLLPLNCPYYFTVSTPGNVGKKIYPGLCPVVVRALP